jgi:Domain of unknown function (DUF4419)
MTDTQNIKAFEVSTVTQETPRKDNLVTFRRFASAMLTDHAIEGIADETMDIRVSKFTDNGFISAVDAAFNNHCALAFGPGHIHLCLLQLLGRVVNERPEEYRDTFVSHEGQETIEIIRDNFGPPGTENDWAGTIPEFEVKIGTFLKEDVREPLTTSFSNSSSLEHVCRGGALMSAFQSYFSYVVATRCGIPLVKLQGTPDDWRALRVAGESIADMIAAEEPTGQWKTLLLEMLDEFVNAADGRPDCDWWRSFYRADSVSGGVLIDGHILTLFPVLKNNYTWRFASSGSRFRGRLITSFPSTIVSAPFIWKYYDTTIEMKFMTGMWGATVLEGEFYTPALNMVVINTVSKSDRCKTDCIAKRAGHVQTFADLSALQAYASNYSAGGFCDQCRGSLDGGKIIHCDKCRTDFCSICIDKLGLV